jgi:hypothetical protein
LHIEQAQATATDTEFPQHLDQDMACRSALESFTWGPQTRWCSPAWGLEFSRWLPLFRSNVRLKFFWLPDNNGRVNQPAHFSARELLKLEAVPLL